MKVLQDRAATEAVVAHNRSVVARAVGDFTPDVCLLGNIDFLGTELLRGLLEADVPVLHSIGASTPGYPVDEAPQGPNYRALPASSLPPSFEKLAIHSNP
jgi:hypothetical protein